MNEQKLESSKAPLGHDLDEPVLAHQIRLHHRRHFLSLIAAALGITSGVLVGRPEIAAAETAAAPPAVTISHPVQRELIEWDEYSGQFAAVEYVEIRARVSGYLTEIRFKDGQFVKKGDVLFIIDPRPYEATLAAARAQLAQANAQVDLANRQLERSSELRKRDFEAASIYDQRVSDLRVATAAVENAKAAIRSAELNVEFTRIVAPVSGRISNHQVSVGNLITGDAGATTAPLTTIVSLDPIYFYFDMSEADYLAYQRAGAIGKQGETPGSTPLVYVRLADENEWTRKGQLNFVDNQIDRSAGTVRARAVLANPDFLIAPGQFGRIRVPASERYEALLVPDAAIVSDQSRKLVMTVKEDGTVEPKIVQPGPGTDDGLRIIRSGLSLADQIIINGLIRARPGGKVTPQLGKIETTPCG
jgi:RND family efflux transporter MFP subunit